ncbi:peptidylprolyl isomerase [Kangiella taiwanensis]|uniref:Peptidylprolyl isomerase n=1 Tax=Kangiella taiwanensis TaxID=1079179 RepID=A0ABP8I659_9GAMM|nr:peptidylprolyl isomerase [Kangiella taiwanensis]
MKASARHILVTDEELCQEIKKSIESGVDFSAMAAKHSVCPSKSRGGELGVFRRGMMVREFDDVVFTRSLKIVHGPIKTTFGFHLIEIMDRDVS